MPYHEVIKQDNETTKFTKFRIVFDASASKPSLNESLYKGSADLLKLLDRLMDFRIKPIGLTRDINNIYKL